MWEQTIVFFVWVGCAALILAFFALLVTLLGLAVGESPRDWWRGVLVLMTDSVPDSLEDRDKTAR